MRYHHFSLIVTLFFVFGCDEAKQVSFHEYEFTTLLKKRSINLSNHLGNIVSIERNGDTLTYQISFNKSSKINYIINQFDDTLFAGTVSKTNKIFLLNSRLKNGNYSISPISFTDSTITGLDQDYKQLRCKELLAHTDQYRSMICDTTRPNILTIDKKIGKQYFNALLNKLSVERLIIDKDIVETLALQNTLDSTGYTTQFPKGETRVYPNPFTSILTVRTTNSLQTVNYTLVDYTGKIIRSGLLSENGGEIDCTDLLTGKYLLILPMTEESICVVKE